MNFFDVSPTTTIRHFIFVQIQLVLSAFGNFSTRLSRLNWSRRSIHIWLIANCFSVFLFSFACCFQHTHALHTATLTGWVWLDSTWAMLPPHLLLFVVAVATCLRISVISSWRSSADNCLCSCCCCALFGLCALWFLFMFYYFLFSLFSFTVRSRSGGVSALTWLKRWIALTVLVRADKLKKYF